MLQKQIEIVRKIKEKAFELGFSEIGFAKTQFLETEVFYLKQFLENKFHGEMKYLENHFDKRLNPELLVEGSKSVMVVLLNYFPSPNVAFKSEYKISKYAYGKDYHLVMKEKLQTLFDFINTQITAISGRIFTDSAPVLEKAWAIKAGLGWLGKNGLLLTKNGSYFFIGEIISNLNLDEYFVQNPNVEMPSYCGTCRRCIEACPTQAIEKEHSVNATKCISYLTIESKSPINPAYKQKMENYIYGCDICQEVCPWNSKAKAHNTNEFNSTPEIQNLQDADWLQLNPIQFNELFKNSPIKRIKYGKLMMNIDFLH